MSQVSSKMDDSVSSVLYRNSPGRKVGLLIKALVWDSGDLDSVPTSVTSSLPDLEGIINSFCILIPHIKKQERKRVTFIFSSLVCLDYKFIGTHGDQLSI